MGLNRPLHARLGRHFAVTAAVAAAHHAHAEVIYSGPRDLGIPSTTQGLYLNVVTGAFSTTGGTAVPGWDVNPWQSTTLGFFNPAAPTGGVYARTNGTTGVSNLSPGTTIDSSSVWSSGTAQTTGTNPFVFSSDQNIVGFRFLNEATGLTHYGWFRVRLSASLGAQPRALVDWAYESTPETAISAGAAPPPPPYDPCSEFNPTLASGINVKSYRTDSVPALSGCGSPIPAANYYRFTAGSGGSYSFQTCPSAGTARIAVLSACDGSGSVLACGSSACAGTGSVASAALGAGETVYVAVGGTGLGSAVPITVSPPPIPECTGAPTAGYGDTPISSASNPGVNQVVFTNLAQTTTTTVNNRQWFRFTPAATGAFTFKTCGAGDTKLAIGTACPSTGVTFSTIAYNDNAPGCPTGGSATTNLGSWIDATNNAGTGTPSGLPLTQNLIAGTTYFVCVGGFGATTVVNGFLNISGPDGSPYNPCSTANPTVALGANLKAYRTDSVANLATCGTTIPAANYYKFTPTVDGTHTFTACPSSGAATLAILGGCTPGSAVISCGTAATCATGSGSSATAALTAGTDVYVVVGGSGLPQELSIAVVGPPVEACVTATTAAYGANPVDTSVSTGSQFVQSNAANTAQAQVYKPVWLKFTPTATGDFQFSYCGSLGDTMLAIGQSCPSIGTRFLALAYNDDSCATQSCIDGTNCGATGTFAGFPLTQQLVAGTTYYVCIGGFSTTTVVNGVLNITGPEGSPCPADLNDDQQVNGDDLAILLTSWGPCSGCAADFNGSGQVDGDDLATLLTAWGPCP